MVLVEPVADEGEQFARPRTASGALYFDGAVGLAPHPAEGDEISEFAFRERGKLDGLPIAWLSRRVHTAFDARAAGRTMYLEHGVVVPRGG